MTWVQSALRFLHETPVCGYHAQSLAASEPTALAALALLGWHEDQAALPPLQWLCRLQQPDGSVGVREREPTPSWPTALAALAWAAASRNPVRSQSTSLGSRAKRAVESLLQATGAVYPPDKLIEHDTTLAAWPWVDGTHSWIEPTSFNVLAMKATGKQEHERTCQAVKMLLDRQLPDGGCNYGNRIVLGQVLRPHIQPTGIALVALNGTLDLDGRISRSVGWLRRTVNGSTTAASMAWGLLGQAAHGEIPSEAEKWLEAAWERELRLGPSPYKAALLLLAALGSKSPLITLQIHDGSGL